LMIFTKTCLYMSTLKPIFAYLQKLFPDAKTELNYSTPFQLLVAVILSAQTTDKQVNKVTNILFQKIKQPKDLIKLWFDDFKTHIKTIGLYNGKAKNIRATANILVKKPLPKTLQWLQELPWVGEKTAKVIGQVLYDMPVIAVDTHVHRVCNRLWIVKTNSPLQTSKLLEKVIPNTYKSIAHHCLILFGRYYCTARNPKCETCKLQKICVYYKTITSPKK